MRSGSQGDMQRPSPFYAIASMAMYNFQNPYTKYQLSPRFLNTTSESFHTISWASSSQY